MVSIRHATMQDAALLAELAARTFAEAFGADNRPEDLALHLARLYGVAQQSAELADAAVTTLLASADAQVAGYAQLRAGPPPDCVAGPEPLELWRFYVDRPWHGRGVAQELMRAVLDAAQKRGARTLWLGVWERNARAQAFYRKYGFVDVGSHLFVVGTDPQKDRILTRPLPEAQAAG
jgi:ribosomal protein S18 acetylase RimI-like enzyme